VRDFLTFAWLRRRLALKAALIFGGLIGVFALVTLAFNVLGERNEQARRAIQSANPYAVRIAESAMRAGALDHADVLAVAAEAARQDQIAYVKLVDRNGDIILERGMFDASWSRPDAELVRSAIRRGTVGASTHGGAGHVSYPVIIGGRVVGAARVTAAMHGAGAEIGAVFRRSLIATLLGLGLILPLSGLYLLRAMRPVSRIIETAQAASRGRLDARLDIRTGDELQDLAEGFNAMLDRLRGSLEHVHQLAYADHLTGLPNKTAFLEHARGLLRAGESAGAMFLIDLDRFKRLNDTFGAKQGDRLIRMAGQRIQAAAARYVQSVQDAAGADAAEPACRSILARVTADEFALIVSGGQEAFTADLLAAEIVRAIEQPMEILGQNVVITCSVGIAAFPRHGAEPELLLRNANLALDEVKKAGGASHRLFDDAMTQAAMARVTLEHELRRAIERDEFVVHYQPKVAARSGRLAGVEALVRWRRPDGALRAPGSFILVAEETGLIAEMGDFVLREACRAAARWRDAGLDIQVSVNVSALQFERRDFRQTVQQALVEAGLKPEALELEITESTAMTDPERALAQIEPLRRLGVRFAIDDFGTGHSSLAHLTRMPFDTFKIDQSFVHALGEDPSARVIVQTILALARSLRLDVVAEGAETAEQVATLQSLGCNIIQGFYFAKPMPEVDFIAYARRAPVGEDAPRPSATVIAPFGVAK
jgi:diguanylate cyclase (GGDEF)-like protein